MSFTRRQFLKLSGLGTAGVIGRFLPETIVSPSPKRQPVIPERISRNSVLGLVAPASPVYDKNDFDDMLVTLKELGFTLKLGRHVRDRRGFLAGEDKDRARDLMDMFEDSTVDAILCVRGGWGCNRILDYLDFDIIRNNPKPLIGFSDITSLHMSIASKAGLVTYHGPVGTSEWNNFTTSSFDDTLIAGKATRYSIPQSELAGAYTIHSGTARGRLLGGNLTVLAAMLGSEYLPDFTGSILFVEDVDESVYRVDRLITQLKLAGILEQINGFIFGRCTECASGANSLPLEQIFDDHIKPLGIPAFYGAMISHEPKNVTIPVGLPAEMDADTLTFRMLQAGVI